MSPSLESFVSETHTKRKATRHDCLPTAHLAGRCGKINWNSLQWGKIYFCTGPTRAAKAGPNDPSKEGPFHMYSSIQGWGGGGAKSYDGEKALSYINHSIISGAYQTIPLKTNKSINFRHCNEIPIYVFLFWEVCGLSPNFHIHLSVSDLYFPRIQDRSTYFPAAE
jgi:hypothetical protein